MADDVTKNPWPKRIGIGLLVLVALIAAVVLLGLAWINGSGGRAFVEDQVESMEFSGQSVAIDGLDGSVLGAFGIDRIALSDADGVWMVAQDVSVDWSPRAVLSKALEVNSLTVGDLDVLRRPELVPGEPSEDPRITTFDIDDVSLPDISLAEAVIGRALQASAEGRLRHGPDGGEAVLTMQTDGGDEATADLAWSPDLVLSGNADIDGAPGGLLARLLRLEDGQSVDVDVTTDGPETRIAARIAGTDFLTATILRGDDRIVVDGTADLARLPVAEQAASLLGGPAMFEADLPTRLDGPAQLSLTAPRATLRASGSRNDGLIILDDVAFEATDPLQGFDANGMSIGRVVANGRATLGPDGYAFDGTVAGTDITYQGYRIERLNGPARLDYLDGVLGFDTDLSGRAMGRTARVNAQGSLDMGVRSIRLDRADLSIPGLTFEGSGTVGYGEGVSARVNGRYDVDTSVFRDGPAAMLAGDIAMRTGPDGPTARLSGRATRITGLASAVEPLTGDGLDYEATVTFADGVATVPSFTASNAIMRATGSGRWSDGRLSADVDYQVERYRFAAVDAQTIQGEATLSGPPSEIAFETDLTIREMDASALTLTDVAVSATGTYSGGTTRATGTLRGETRQGLVQTSGTVALNSEGWSVTDLDGTLGDLRTTGTLSGIGGDIAALRGDLAVSGTSPLIPAERIEADILLADAQVDVQARIDTLNRGRLQDTDVVLTAKGPREAVAFTIAADGQVEVREIVRDMTFEAQGTADLAEPDLSVSAPFDLAVGRQTATGTLAARRGTQGWGGEVAADTLGGSLSAALEPGADGRAVFELDALEVAEIMMALGRPVAEGALSGSGTFAFMADRIEGDAALTLDGLRNPGSDAEAVDLQVDIGLRNERLLATLSAQDGALDGQARLEGLVDTMPGAPFLQWPPATPLSGTANLSGDIGPLAELFLPPLTDVSGEVVTDMTFSVPMQPGRLDGRFSLSDGEIEQGSVGLFLTDIDMTATLSGDRIDVPSLTARGKKGGTLRGSGRMGLGEGTGSVDIQAERLRVVSRREGHADMSGTLSLSRTTELFRLTGDLSVVDAEIDIGKLPEPGLPTLDVRFQDMEAETEDAQGQSQASRTTEIDLTIRSDGRINVKGRGLDALMQLDATVTGSFDDPTIAGEARIDRGRFDFLGKRFVFQDSSLIIADDVMQSRLNMTAVRETSDLTATVSITGTVSRPDIELSSEPTLPEDEVLSRILFGRSPTQLSAIETARLAAALAQFSGGSGFDLLGSLENAVGLDTLDIGQSDTGETQLTTGKYLSDDVYLEVRSAAEGTPGVAVEWQARRNISVEAETVPGERQRISVQWKKDFD